MKKLLALLILLAALTASQAYAGTITYGKGVHLDETTPISAILAAPDEYIGKTVRIEGIVIEVCAKRGCWIYIGGDKPGEKIQVKVVDGEIVFPMSASGQMGIVEGVVEELAISREEMIKYMQHLAEEKGQPFDPATVTDERMIRLRGIGAEIQE